MERLVHIFNPFTEREHRQFMNMDKWFHWHGALPYDYGYYTPEMIRGMAATHPLRVWMEGAEIGEKATYLKCKFVRIESQYKPLDKKEKRYINWDGNIDKNI